MSEFSALVEADDPVEVTEIELVSKVPLQKTKAERIRELENIESEVLLESFDVVSAMLRFAEVEPDEQGPSQAWIREFGMQRAKRMHRVAQLSHKNSKEAPIALSAAPKIMQGILSARKGRDERVTNFNVALVALGAPVFNYEVRMVEE